MRRVRRVVVAISASVVVMTCSAATPASEGPEPVPLPEVKPAESGPVPIPVVRPSEPGPVPMPEALDRWHPRSGWVGTVPPGRQDGDGWRWRWR